MTEKAIFWLGFVASLALSVSGILLGMLLPGRAADAGRGGALGTALALGFLFINRDYGAKFYRAISVGIPALKELFDRWEREKSNIPPPKTPPLTLVELQHRVDVLAVSIAFEGQGHAREARFMGAATAIGTIAWGFGDWIAQDLLKVQWVITFQHWALRVLCNAGFNF